MTTNAKIVIGIIVVLLVAGGVYWFMHSKGTSSWNSAISNSATSSDSTALPSGNDTSDAALDQDMASINANLSASASDESDVDQSVNDEAGSGTPAQ